MHLAGHGQSRVFRRLGFVLHGVHSVSAVLVFFYVSPPPPRLLDAINFSMYSAWSYADNFVFSAVMSLFQPGYLQKLLPESAPDEPEALEDILKGNFFVGDFLSSNGT